MNQKVVIYIILSAILLYLYYKRGDLAIFAAFVAVVVGTLIFRSGNASAREGMSIGGGGGKGDKECAKLGFTAPKMDKDDLAGSLEKAMKIIKTVADKHWPYDDLGGKTDDEDKKKAIELFVKEFQKEAKNKDEKENQMMNTFIMVASDAYEKRKMEELLANVKTPEKLENVITGGKLTLKILEKLSKSNKIDSSFKKTLKYLICLCKHWTTIFKAIQKANGGGDEADDEDGGGDEEKSTKKKKATKKKKSKKDDDDADADAEDE